MQRSESIANLAKALALAQGEIKGAAKDTNNPFFHSKYADLASVWDACRGPLSKNGLAVIQLPHPVDKFEGLYETRAVVETILTHESGEWISGVISLPVLGPDLKGGGRGEVNAQSFGSAITYARRYGLASIVGVYQDDEDGDQGEGAPSKAMDEHKVADHLTAIQDAADLGALQKVFAAAFRAAGRDNEAIKRLTAAKDARKTVLQAADKKGNAKPAEASA
jgi:hypothetical protein